MESPAPTVEVAAWCLAVWEWVGVNGPPSVRLEVPDSLGLFRAGAGGCGAVVESARGDERRDAAP